MHHPPRPPSLPLPEPLPGMRRSSGMHPLYPLGRQTPTLQDLHHQLNNHPNQLSHRRLVRMGDPLGSRMWLYHEIPIRQRCLNPRAKELYAAPRHSAKDRKHHPRLLSLHRIPGPDRPSPIRPRYPVDTPALSAQNA